MRHGSLTLAVALAVVVSAQAQAANEETLGTFGKWTAFTASDNGKTMCYMAVKPAKSEGGYKSRGDVFFTVTDRPAEKSFDVVSIVAGYQYQPDSEVAVTIGKKSWALFTSADRAWARDFATDKAIVGAMGQASKVLVKGTSNHGTPTTDTFLVSGFKGAYKAMSAACKPAGKSTAKPANKVGKK